MKVGEIMIIFFIVSMIIFFYKKFYEYLFLKKWVYLYFIYCIYFKGFWKYFNFIFNCNVCVFGKLKVKYFCKNKGFVYWLKLF